jgi:hypothetical protein
MLSVNVKLDDDDDILIKNSFSMLFFFFRKMTETNQNDLAIQRFVEYIQIKTVQPEPDYDSALKFLKNYAQELGLDYCEITTDENRQAAVLTVKR